MGEGLACRGAWREPWAIVGARGVMLRWKAFLCSLLCLQGLGASGWVTREAPLWSLAGGAGRLVAVGEGGLVLESLDGRAWRPVGTGLAGDLRGVAFGEGRFVAVGGEYALLGLGEGTWRPVRVGPGAGLWGVVHGPHGFVAAGARGLWHSRDGRAWELVAQGEYPVLASGEGWYLAGGPGGQGLVSRDGRSWRGVTLPRETSCLARAGGRLLAGTPEGVYASQDGRSWAPVGGEVGCPLRSVGGRLYALAQGRGDLEALLRLLESRDGKGWNPTHPALKGVFQALDLWVGEEGILLLEGEPMSGGTGIWVLEGKGWRRAWSPSVWAHALAHGGGVLVGVGPYGSSYWSRDGVVWRKARLDADLEHLGGVAYGPAGFLTHTIHGRLFLSRDGRSWKPVGAVGQGEMEVRDLLPVQGGYLALAQGRMGEVPLFSRDGRRWEAFRGALSPAVRALGRGVRLALWEGVVHRERAGRWHPLPHPLNPQEDFQAQALAYGDRGFAALTLGGEILTSPDGKGWRRAWSLPPVERADLVWGPGRFVAVGVDRGRAVLATWP